MVHINKIHIRNYKSLEDTLLEDCRTYNLLLGRPNVGKSNILEALSLFSLPYLLLEKREISDLLRYQHNISELFFDGDVSRTIMVQAGDDEVALERVEGTKFNWTADFEGLHEQLTVTGGRLVARKNNSVSYPVFKRYDFSKLNRFSSVELPFLLPIGGENIMQIIRDNPSLTTEISNLVAEYGLQLLFDTSTQEIKFQKKLGENTVFSIPFFSVSATLQRLIFYKSVIEGNRNSVIMLEEIEAHSYPPYISKVTNCILDDESNQYFITTHSPYVVNDFLEKKDKDVAIYLVDLQDGKNIVRKLSDNELEEVYDDGIDLFFNGDMFLK